MKINNQLVDIYSKDVIIESKFIQEWLGFYESLTSNPIAYYFSKQDLDKLAKLATSPSMATNPKERDFEIGELMKDRGFQLVGGGTNRRYFMHCVDRVGAKVATDKVGFLASMREYFNQNVIKPFCTKIFEVSELGIVSLSERFVPFKTMDEYAKYAEAIHEILFYKFRQNNIGMEDIGLRSYKNWGVRPEFGPGLLDFPTMYVLDPKKRYCDRIVNGHICGGTMDYDEGYDIIRCNECRTTYHPKDLALTNGTDLDLLLEAVGYKQHNQIKERNVYSMKLRLFDEEGKSKVIGGNSQKSSNFIDPTKRGGRRNFSPIDLSNGSLEKPYKERHIKFKLIDANPTPADTPVQTPEKKSVEPEDKVVNYENDTINEVLTQDYKVDYSYVISAFDKAVTEAAIEFEANSSDDYARQIVSVIEKKFASNCAVVLDEDKAVELYGKVFLASVDNPDPTVFITDDYMLTSKSSYLSRKLANQFPNCSNNYKAFKMLISTVSNATSFAECLAAYFKTMLNNFSFEIDEVPGGIITYKVPSEVFNVYIAVVKRVIEDFVFNVKASGTLTYNPANAFRIFRDSLTVMNNKFEGRDLDSMYVEYIISDSVAKIRLFEPKVSNDGWGEEPEQSGDEVEPEEESGDEGEPVTEEPKTTGFECFYDSNKPMSKKQKNKFNKEKGKRRHK